ncbi:putative trichothecene 3-O-acetyltransferase [Aspergillus affinis]|uniref:putative trichothecene 3-O-acetyltransferase n=1 Tax=Aspergillus affinis TaxID=1070780 RepID=UPI0022FDB5F7|nr:putative trichothecene 3-O-acetyltransferase [Aspergillus affinis]KAI9045409.1 putative trichothecene 3-O-acetyltransferase [Aspergillus affinis]
MSNATITADIRLTNFRLDIFGQIPALKSYTNISSVYSVPDASSRSSIIDTLVKGLERLAASFPWVAGRVVVEGNTEGNTGVCKIKPFAKLPPLLVVRDYQEGSSALSMGSLRDAQFPMSMLDESLVAPISTLPADTDFPNGRPVFLVQATFIPGGLILTFVGEHRAMDITGQNHLIHLLSKACGDEPFSPVELSIGNMPRHNIIPPLEDHDADSHLPGQFPPNTPAEHQQASTPPSTWACFHLSSSSLSALKSLTNESLLASYISTDDALSAFIWQSILRARRPRIPSFSSFSYLSSLSSSSSSTLLRAVDLRPILTIPQTYPGVLMMVTPTTSPLHHQELPLGHLASLLRTDIHPNKLSTAARTFATTLHHTPDKRRVPFAPNMNPATNVMFSSWSKVALYALHFHLGLGCPEAVRRPRLFPVEGLVYAMPRDREGGIVVEVCLRDEDLARLRRDGAFSRFATYIG